MSAPSKNAFLSRRTLLARRDKSEAEQPRAKTYDLFINGSQQAKYRKRITLAKVSIQKDDGESDD